jgi:carbonic anhydrase/acetyltransferase-like protein (isoleucine patch superfamily)
VDADRLVAAEGKRVAVPLIRHHGVTPRIEPSAWVAPDASVIGEVTVGAESSVWFQAVLRGDINAIRIGARTNVQDGCVLHVTNEAPVEIGDEVTLGHMAMVHGCTVGHRTLIGMNAVVLDFARIGTGCLVAAGAVVRERMRVPDGVLVAGVPAKIVRELTGEERQGIIRSAANYVAYAATYRS